MQGKKLVRQILISSLVIVFSLPSAYAGQKIEKKVLIRPSKIINVQGLLEEVEASLTEGGGLQSGRTQLCYEESGYSPGGDSDLASPSVKTNIPKLVNLLHSSKDPEVLSRAARLLSLINSKAVPMMATPLLERLLKYKSSNARTKTGSSEEQQVRSAAADALKCIMSNTSNPQYRGFEIRNSGSLATPTQKDIETRVNMLVASLEKERSNYSDYCLNIDEYKPYKYETEFASLSRIGFLGQSTVNPLLKHLSNKSPAVRVAVVRSLSNTGLTRQDGIKSLIGLLNDKCIVVRNETIIALGEIGSNAKSATEPLIKELTNHDARLRANIAQSIGNIGNVVQVGIDALRERLKDDNKYVRVKAAIALLKIQSTDRKTINLAVNELLLSLKDDNPDLRLVVVKDLGDLERIPPDLINLLIRSFANKLESWELRLNSFFVIAHLNDADRVVLQPTIKPFLIEALRKNSIPRYFHSSNVLSVKDWIGSESESVSDINEETHKYRERLLSFYKSWPIDKRHAFFLAGIEPGTFSDFNQALREILIDKSSDYKARYNSSFMLGFVESSSTPSSKTINTLKFIMNDSKEDFDIRWISAFSLTRLKQDSGIFFQKHHLPNPMQIYCYIDKFGDRGLIFDPYFGWCETSGSGGAGSSGWAKVIMNFFGSRKRR